MKRSAHRKTCRLLRQQDVLRCGSWLCLIVLGCNAEEDAYLSFGADGSGGNSSLNSETRDGSGSAASSGTRENVGGSSRASGGVIPIISSSPDTVETSSNDTKSSCGSMQVDAEVKTVETVIESPGNVLFVFDQSSSMSEAWQGTPKWQAANDAVVAAFTPLQTKLNAGAILYPTGASTDPTAASTCDPLTDLLGCLVGAVGTGVCPDVAPISSAPQLSIQSGQSFLSKWKSYWSRGAAALGVGTPTEKGLLQAEAALAVPPDGATAVVLVTDGEPTCGANESVIAARLLKKSIKTYVVGLPGGVGVSLLDKVAIAGGTAAQGCKSNCYMTPASGGEFQKALASIVTTIVTTTTETAIVDCEFQLSPPDDARANADDVHLIVTEASSGQQFEVPRVPGAWTLSADASTATFEGPVCDAAKTGALSSVSFQYGCVSVPEWTSPLL